MLIGQYRSAYQKASWKYCKMKNELVPNIETINDSCWPEFCKVNPTNLDSFHLMRSDLTAYGPIRTRHQNQNQPKRVIMSCHFPNSCQLESAKYIQNIFLPNIYLQNSHQKWHYADRNFIQSFINIGDDCIKYWDVGDRLHDFGHWTPRNFINTKIMSSTWEFMEQNYSLVHQI